jgi:hypothetical protein
MAEMHAPNQGSNPLQKYFRQPKIYVSLPSSGEFYPQGVLDKTENNEYPVYAMTAKDELTMKTPDALLNGEATVSVIESCMPNIKDGWKIPSLDLDAILIAIRIATYGEMMDLHIKVPVTGEEKTFQTDLRVMLDSLNAAEYNNVVELDGMKVILRPLTYREFTELSIKTFEEQRIFSIVNDDDMPEEEKLLAFNRSFTKLTDMTVGTLKASIAAVQFEDQTVTNKEHISEFVDNADKDLFKKVTDHLETQKESFSIKPMVVDATEEEIEAGVPETYEIPITFDQTNFFG